MGPVAFLYQIKKREFSWQALFNWDKKLAPHSITPTKEMRQICSSLGKLIFYEHIIAQSSVVRFLVVLIFLHEATIKILSIKKLYVRIVRRR
jgi:hypothetical protein